MSATVADPEVAPATPSAPSGSTTRPLRVGFVMEQVLGHVTWYQNLRGAVSKLDGVEPRWIETTLFDEGGRLERLPGLPGFARAGARALLDVRRGLRDQPCDVLLFNTQKAAMFCQWQMLRTPTMLMTDVTPRQYDRMAELYDHRPDENPAVRLAKHRANVLNFRLARALLPSSTWCRDSMVREYGVAPERAHVIPVGADTDYWRPIERAPNERVRLLFVGGHFDRKGGRLLLEAFRNLGLADRAELHVVTRTEGVATAGGVVVHRGVTNNSPELLQLYQQADVFVLPTLADCFGNASIEALATGLPVVTTAMGGIPDIVEHGRCGYLLPPGDGRVLAEVLRRLVDDAGARRAMGAAARQRALTHFDARVNAARILDLARTLHAERRRGARAA